MFDLIAISALALYLWMAWFSPTALMIRSMARTARSTFKKIEAMGEHLRSAEYTMTELQRAAYQQPEIPDPQPWKGRSVKLSAKVTSVRLDGWVNCDRDTLFHPRLRYTANFTIPLEVASSLSKGQRIRFAGEVVNVSTSDRLTRDNSNNYWTYISLKDVALV